MNVGILAEVTAQYFFYKVYFMYLLYILIMIVTGMRLKRCLTLTRRPYWNRHGNKNTDFSPVRSNPTSARM